MENNLEDSGKNLWFRSQLNLSMLREINFEKNNFTKQLYSNQLMTESKLSTLDYKLINEFLRRHHADMRILAIIISSEIKK